MRCVAGYCALVFVAACGNDSDAVETESSTSSGSTIAEIDDGDTAVWLLDPDGLPVADSDTFTALVSRLGCSGGETGEVFDPSVEVNAHEVVVTFTVTPLPPEGVATCPGNKPVPYVVHLDEPLRSRTIVDGACRGSEAASTSWCEGELGVGGERWPRPGQ